MVLERYNIKGTDFEICDVGGQRTERRKWIDCFENIDAVFFVAALSEYDQRVSESRGIPQNRMMEALNLFESIIKNAAFENNQLCFF